MSLISDDPNYYARMYNNSDIDKKRIRILDSTLREGEQHPGNPHGHPGGLPRTNQLRFLAGFTRLFVGSRRIHPPRHIRRATSADAAAPSAAN